jgi:hypothetical protein
MNKRILYGMTILIASLMMITPNIAGVLAPDGPGVVYQETFYGMVNARFTWSAEGYSETETDQEMALITITVYDDNTVNVFFDFPFWSEDYTGKIRVMVNKTNYLFIAAWVYNPYDEISRIRIFIRITPSGLDLRMNGMGYFNTNDAPPLLVAPGPQIFFFGFTYIVRHAEVAVEV